MRKSKKVIALTLAAMMAVSAFAGCSGDTSTADSTTTTPQASSGAIDTTTTNATTPAVTETLDKKATKLSVMVPYGSHSNDELDLTIEFRDKLESYTNTDITWELYDSTAYYEKLTLKYASGELTTVVVTDKNAEFLSACKYNTFWDVMDYLDLFDNLASIPDVVRKNASNAGHLYGLPRSRDLGRNACAYRQDWADNLGLGHPETIDDLYDMAVQFTNNDPDGNGKNDTYAFALDGWTGQWNIMLPWFGVHNVWGLDENGELEYYATQEEYKTALKAFRQWYSEGLIPENFRSTNPGSADKELLRTNIAGISVQIAAQARRAQEAMNGTATAPGTNPEAKFTYFISVDGGYGDRALPTDGFGGYVAITKSHVPTEDDLMPVLQFLNDMNDAEMRNLVDYGLLGKDYYIDENGYGVKYTAEEKTAMGISTAAYREGYNQFIPYYSCAEEAAKLITSQPTSEAKAAEMQIMQDAIPFCIANEGAGYTSQTYIDKGTDLDMMITNAMLDFIDGTIDETQLDAIHQQWLEAGGQAYIDEMRAAYAAGNK